MTRDEQIEAALEVLHPPPDKRETCLSNIEHMLDAMKALSENNTKYRSKAAGKAWSAHHRALCRLRTTHINLAATGWGVGIELADIESAIEASTPEQYHRRAGDSVWEYAGSKQDRAVELACALLSQWGGKVTTTRKNGKWWRLAAILYGDRNADLFRYMRAFAASGQIKSAERYPI